MARRCKNCDPNKYIEGVAYRGPNGASFDNYSTYLDVGQPYDGNGDPSSAMLADVGRMLSAYNPLFTRNSPKGLQVTSSPILSNIKGVDRANGFWLIWSLSDGLMAYGTPGVKSTPANIDLYLQNGVSITNGNRSVATIRKGQRFKVEMLTDRIPSDFDYTEFGNFAGASTSDPLRFVVWDNNTDAPSSVYNSPISNINTIYKATSTYVGYFTGYIKSIINGSRYVTVGSGKNKRTVLETFSAKRSLTVKVQSSEGYDRIQVTSSPGLVMFKGQQVNYTITTNHPVDKFSAIPTSQTADIIRQLGLTWNSTNKTITGSLSSIIPTAIQTATLTFILAGADSSSGNSQTFNLNILYGAQDTKVVMPTVHGNFTYSLTVGKAFNDSIRALNGKQKIVSVTNLPEGLNFNTTNNKITGTPKHAGYYTCYVNALNARGSVTGAINFNIIDYFDKDPSDGNTFPSQIGLPQAPYDTVKNNSFKFKFYVPPGGDDTIQYKKIDRSEIATIVKNGKPDGTIYTSQNISEATVGREQVTFFPGRGKDAQTCFWMQLDDPTAANAKATKIFGKTVPPNYQIDINVEYTIGDATAGLADQTGRICFSPDGTNGPVSSPYSQSLSVTCTNVIRDAFSGNPADNEPAIAISPSYTEYQIVYLTPRDGGVLTKVPSFANQRLGVSGLLKYPNGIPANRGTYPFIVFFTDICAFNNSLAAFTSYLETYRSPVRGDIYQCSHQGTCFVEGTRVLTPEGYKNIETFKPGDTVFGYDEKLNLTPCKVKEFLDHNKEKYPIFKVTFDNGTILKATKSHPFLTPKGDYILLNDLNVGDYVVSLKNGNVKILSIEGAGFDIVYNIEVENLNNYIAEDIFVHNTAVGTVQCGKYGCRQWNGKQWVPKGRITIYTNMVLDRDYASVNDLPGNCRTLLVRGGGTQKVDNYGFQYRNTLLESKDIGITSLTNISILDILSEGPIEGIVDYEVKPKFTDSNGNTSYPQKGDIGWKNGVTITPYAQGSPQGYLRSIYWNEVPIADQSFPAAGSLNFEFVRLAKDNGDSAPRHLSLDEHKNIFIEEEFYSKKLLNGQKLEFLSVKNANTNQVYSNQVKFPRRLTQTKTVGSRLFGKRIFQDGSEKTYKKSITVMTKDLYALKLHIKAISLSKSVIDLTIWESFDAAENNSEAGRVDRQTLTFNLTLKRIEKGSGTDGLTYTTIPVPDHKGVLRNSRQLMITGKLYNGSYMETFEWSGLNRHTTNKTIGWEIEIEPTYLESVDANIILKSSLDSITEIYNDFLVLPHTASIITTFDSRFFQSIPQRSYDIRLLKVKIPENYDPFSRTYNGIWNGNFKLAWTDNPAWCFYDLITNRRYGLGKYVDPDLTDKWTLYEIAKYCDELVSDGKGFLEPRFTCNLLISTKEDAYKVLNDMASIFRALIYYNAGVISVSQDAPKEPIYIFNNTNVKDGEFIYSNTSKRVRRNVALVRYNDKENQFKPAVKYVENREGLIKFGIRELEVSAFGCTSEGQAERLGKWMLLSENRESELVSFETSLPALYLKPGDVILVQDQNRQNRILAGRTFSLSKNEAIIDVKYNELEKYMPVIKKCKLNVLTPAGNVEIGTDQGNSIIDFTGNMSPFYIKDGIDNQLVSGITSQIIRRKQIQTIEFEAQEDQDLSLFFVRESGTNFEGFTKINFGSKLDDTEHTLLQNTVWTLEVDPENYDYTKSPSVSGSTTTGLYPGAYLEPYLDQTQKFRVLDIEEQDEHKYKITALQYDELKFALGDDV